MLPTLTVAIATAAKRAGTIELPAPRDGVRYYIGVQLLGEVPEEIAARADVEVEHLCTTGLSRNRNAALAACKTELLLLADDDLSWRQEGIDALRAALAADPRLDIAAGRLEDTTGEPLKKYPTAAGDLRLLNCGHVGSPEIMLRMAFVRAHELLFDERFGAGCRYPSGEEYIFITDAIKQGARVRYIPHVVAIHPPMSTGENWSDLRLIDARSRVLGRVWGRAAPLVRIAYAIKKYRRLGLKRALRFALTAPITQRRKQQH